MIFESLVVFLYTDGQHDCTDILTESLAQVFLAVHLPHAQNVAKSLISQVLLLAFIHSFLGIFPLYSMGFVWLAAILGLCRKMMS